MNTANKLTILRVIMIPAFLLVLYLHVPGANYWALVIFAAASITDTLDGYIARHYNQTTDFGKFMDPLADKCLVTAAMLWFVEVGQMPAWALLIVIVREFGVSGLRMVGKGEDRHHHGLYRPDAAAHPSGGEQHLHRPHCADHHLLRCGVFYEEFGCAVSSEIRRTP